MVKRESLKKARVESFRYHPRNALQQFVVEVRGGDTPRAFMP